ncbi:hypothetical protein ABTM67_19490, partial [Acinetobacter baumannii]
VQSFWDDSFQLWQRFLDPEATPAEEPAALAKDKRFKDPAWRENPVFDWLRQSYYLISDHLLRNVEAVDGLDPKAKEQLRFASRAFVDAV